MQMTRMQSVRTPKLSRELKARIIQVVLDVLQYAPSAVAALSLELYSELAQTVNIGRQKRLFEGYVTEREARERHEALQRLVSKQVLSREEAVEGLEHAAALEIKAVDVVRKLVCLAEPVLCLRLDEPRNETLVLGRGPVTSQHELIQGLLLHSGIDGRLLKVQLVRDRLLQRKAALSLVGLISSR